jgi:ligand-binding SRPBCC domain-containing protein
MGERVFSTEQVLPLPRDRVFAFFAEPGNLEAITPPWLRFRILDRTTPGIERGTELTYRLRIHGLPVTWRSRIEEWEPGERFVDVQLRGPYAAWHHTHTFEDRDGGTLLRDRVVYRLPLGRLGHWLAGRLVASDVRAIFAYRAARTSALLLRS